MSQASSVEFPVRRAFSSPPALPVSNLTQVSARPRGPISASEPVFWTPEIMSRFRCSKGREGRQEAEGTHKDAAPRYFISSLFGVLHGSLVPAFSRSQWVPCLGAPSADRSSLNLNPLADYSFIGQICLGQTEGPRAMLDTRLPGEQTEQPVPHGAHNWLGVGMAHAKCSVTASCDRRYDAGGRGQTERPSNPRVLLQETQGRDPQPGPSTPPTRVAPMSQCAQTPHISLSPRTPPPRAALLDIS